MRTYEVRIDTRSLISGLIIITAEDKAHAKEKAMAHDGATGVVSDMEVKNEPEENETQNHEARS